eukprot:TRINITY_DN2814_c0_g1_i1.p1 TRINITY_DN2814_c0_g1~~TRINITY_DN2814_c0_g1_i1.p1  ORF type:complete len:333 (+),score=68.60 TRINITY_DN2814_c0_g1_i1:32-1000(+)
MQRKNLMVIGGVLLITFIVMSIGGDKPPVTNVKDGNGAYFDGQKVVCPKGLAIPEGVEHRPPERVANEGETHEMGPAKPYGKRYEGTMRIHPQIKQGYNPEGYCFVERLMSCAKTITPSQIPRQPPLTAGVEIEGHLLFGRMLYCLAIQPEVNRIFDVFGHVGQGSSYLLAHGLHDSGPEKFMINIEHSIDYWKLQQTNLRGLPVMSLYGSTMQKVPHGPLLDFICKGMKDLDTVLVDGPRKNSAQEKSDAWKEWNTILDHCRPRFLILHNSNVHEEHKVWAKEMESNKHYDIALEGTHDWEVTPDFPVRNWQLYVRRPKTE